VGKRSNKEEAAAKVKVVEETYSSKMVALATEMVVEGTCSSRAGIRGDALVVVTCDVGACRSEWGGEVEVEKHSQKYLVDQRQH